MSLDFDAIDDIVDTNNTLGGIPNGPITFSIWMKADGAGEGGLGAPCRRHGTNIATIGFQATGDRIGFVITRSSQNQARTTDDFSFSIWQNITCTWTGELGNSANSIHIYKNGYEVSYVLTQDGNGTHDTSNGELIIGASATGAGTFDGSLAHCQVWNRVLSVGEILQSVYYPGSIRNNLRAYLPLWGISSTEPDLSGNGVNGPVTGAIKGNTEPPINGIFQVPKPELTGVF